MKAMGISQLVLIYPYTGTGKGIVFEQFQSVWDEDKVIVGLRINPALVGIRGLQSFANALAKALKSISWTNRPM
ncbi:hypothetical protein [Parafannyhessea umbonata]|uniref:hypothetical protein n=1 Tax=Parafannyhessea umbonata TaxID=604330 RepID=UPI00115F845D|nr:hypothetical protein [Parafannyhessea umbonata]